MRKVLFLESNFRLTLLTILLTAGLINQAPTLTAGLINQADTNLGSGFDKSNPYRELKRDISFFTSFSNRLPGSKGLDESAKYIFKRFKDLRLKDVHFEEFGVTVPRQEKANLFLPGGSGTQAIPDLIRGSGHHDGGLDKSSPYIDGGLDKSSPYIDGGLDKSSPYIAGGEVLGLQLIWPNLIYLSSLPEGGIEAPLIRLSSAKLADLKGKRVAGSIVVLDFDTGSDWLNLPRLGAKAVIFVEPELIFRREAEKKFLSTPLPFPRFFILQKEAKKIRKSFYPRVRLESKAGWQEERARNIIGKIEGSDPQLKREVIILEAYYDSISIVPQLSPGAESSLGIVSLLQLIKVFKEHPPKRTIIFLATSAHFQGLSGIRAFISRHFSELESKKLNLVLFVGLDLSSHNDELGVFFKGMYYNQLDSRNRLKRFFSDFATDCREISKEIQERAKIKGVPLHDGVNPIEGRGWESFLFGDYAFDHEAITLAGGPGVGLVTTDDARIFVDTPSDTSSNLNFKNFEKQVRDLSLLLPKIVNKVDLRFPQQRKFRRLQINAGFAKVAGRIVEFDARVNYIPDKPILSSLAVIRHRVKSMVGVRCPLIQKVKGKGAHFEFDGIIPLAARNKKTSVLVEGYKLSPQTGEIIYAPDRGINGAVAYPIEFPVTTAYHEALVVVFRCRAYGIYDLVDPQNFSYLKSVQIYDGETDSEPNSFGFAFPWETDWKRKSEEDCGVIFAEPKMRVKIVMGSGLGANRFLLLNSNFKEFTGKGYLLPEEEGNIFDTSYKAATDLWWLDEGRISLLSKHRIINKGMSDLHQTTRKILDQAKKLKREGEYSGFFSYSRAAWGYETQVYPQVRKTADDVVKGVLFYLAMLLPLCFFLERLIFAFRDLQRQLIATALLFVAFFACFRYIHPAFDITLNPSFVLLAFLILALSLLVIFLIVGKFEEQIKKVRGTMREAHQADVGRMSVAAVALSLGISNMRKRKGRTALTCITLILLTFTVLSFTSVVSERRTNIIPTKGKALYNGILIRNGAWDPPLDNPTSEHLLDEFGKKGIVVGRSWYLTREEEKKEVVIRRTIKRTLNNRSCQIAAVQGLDVEERRVTHLDKTLIGGRWFKKGEDAECILPQKIAKLLKIRERDLGKAEVAFGGMNFKVVGIFSSQTYKKFTDLDGEILTPVDWEKQKGLEEERRVQKEVFMKYTHFEPDDIILISNQALSKVGGDLRSVAISFPTSKKAEKTLEELMKRVSLNIYAGMEGKLYRFSSLTATSLIGLEDLFIPILIAALIVLNTMLGSVYERTKEITTFSSLGLAPAHIGALFLAESLVYAVIGAVSGYLIAQGVVKVIVTFNLLPGLYLNYSSLSAVASTSIVMLVVLLSTIYPAKKASEVATPAIERSWRLPEPEGDTWKVKLPFSVMGEEVIGLHSFIQEWLKSFQEYSVGNLVTEKVKGFTFPWKELEGTLGKELSLVLTPLMGEEVLVFEIDFRSWLAPFDLGVSQEVKLQFLPTSLEKVFDIQLTIKRLSGEIGDWKRTNRRFLTLLRKQFLIWRTLSVEAKEGYIEQGRR